MLHLSTLLGRQAWQRLPPSARSAAASRRAAARQRRSHATKRRAWRWWVAPRGHWARRGRLAAAYEPLTNLNPGDVVGPGRGHCTDSARPAKRRQRRHSVARRSAVTWGCGRPWADSGPTASCAATKPFPPPRPADRYLQRTNVGRGAGLAIRVVAAETNATWRRDRRNRSASELASGIPPSGGGRAGTHPRRCLPCDADGLLSR